MLTDKIIKAVHEDIPSKLGKSDVVNDLTAGGTDKALSAEQGKLLNIEMQNIKRRSFALGNTKICTNALLISDDYDGYTGVIKGQTINLPTGFEVGMRKQLTYDGNNCMVKVYDTQSKKEWINFYNGVNWCGWIENIDKRGGTFSDSITVKKDDGYIEVEDTQGRRIAMHTNVGKAWIHFFNSSRGVISELTFDENGNISSKGTILNNVPCCKAYHISEIVYPNTGVKNILAWDNILFQSEPGMCGNVGTTANLVAKKSGIYQIDCIIDVVNAHGQIQADLSKNNSDYISTARAIPTADGTTTLHLSGMYPLNAGDYVQVHFYNQGSTSCKLSPNRRFQMFMVRGGI